MNGMVPGEPQEHRVPDRLQSEDLPAPGDGEAALPTGPVGATGSQSWLREAAATLPNLVRLLGRLLKDPRVPLRKRALVVATFGYLVSPIDLIPDFIPVVGHADDLLLAALALHHLLNGIDEDVVREHWEGSWDVLELIRGVLEWGADAVPWPLRRAVARYVDRA